MTRIPDRQVPGLHHRHVGEIVVTAVSDGFLDGSLAVFRNITVDETTRLLTEAFRPVPRRTSVNCYLVRTPGHTTLIDCGCGPDMQPSAGKLFDNFAAAGVDPGEIDAVLLTHMHPDHSNGLADVAGEARFPNAMLAMHAAELAYWTSEDSVTRQERSGQGVPYFAGARAQLAPYRDRTRTFTGGEVAPGITAVPLPGHTPGHTGYRIGSGEHALLVWGDIVHLPEVQIPLPEVGIQFDVALEQAQATRRAILAEVAASGQLVAGMHIHFPGYAHVVRDGESYRLLQEAWRLDF
jgi:glyoxylase-like metal-dependent hydrolase (beta-lactamase superfamily II)